MYFYLLLASSLVTTLYLIYIFRKKRFCFLKPSIIFIMFFNIFLQWVSVFYYEDITDWLSSSLFGFIAIFSFVPIIVLYVSSSFFLRSVLTIYDHIDRPEIFTTRVKFYFIIGIFIGFLIYIYYIPINDTGMMAILRGEPNLMIRIMREESLKLLPAFPRYCQTFVTKAICPLIVLTAINEYSIYNKTSGKKLILLAQIFFFITITVIISSFSGARSPVAYIFLCILLYVIFSNKLIFNRNILFKTVLSAVMILSIVTVIEYLRSDSRYWFAAIEDVADRIFGGALFPGIYTISLTESYGNWGVGAINIIATLLGIEPIPVANIVANTFFPTSAIQTGLLNSSFMMTYYAYFGLIAFPVCVALVLFMDVIPWFISKFVRPELHCYAVVGYAATMLSLISADYTYIFLSGGIVFLLLILIAIPKGSIKMPSTSI